MFRTLFGDGATGRLARLPFLGYWILLAVLFVAPGVGLSFVILREAMQGFSSLVMLAVFPIPGDAFGRRTEPPARRPLSWFPLSSIEGKNRCSTLAP